MFIKKFVLFCLLSFILISCEEVIDVELNNSIPNIVIEAQITDQPGPYFVKISKTGNFYDQSIFPAVSGAKVIISDMEANHDTLTEINPGIYQTNSTIGKIDNFYYLNVMVNDNKYYAETRMLKQTKIDSITYKFNSSTGPGQGKNGGYELHCYFVDEPDQRDYCMIKLYLNGKQDDTYFLYNGKFNVSGVIDYNRFRQKFKLNDTIKLELINLEPSVFDYFNTLNNILAGEGMRGIISTGTPANPNTNLSNGALGYFGAFTIDSKTIIINK